MVVVDSTRNVKVPITDGGDGEFQVGFNHSDYVERQWTDAYDAVYVALGDTFGSISIDNATIVRDKLTEIIDTYEPLRPKVPSEREFWQAANIGTVGREGSLFFTKLNKDQIVFSTVDGNPVAEYIATLNSKPGTSESIEVLFEGVEDAAV